MSDQSSFPLHALPGEEAELRLVLKLRWEDIAALGQEASRLATRLQRPVTFDEVVSHKLRGSISSYTDSAQERGQHARAAVAQQAVLPGRSSPPPEQAQDTVAKINGGAGAPTPMPTAAPDVRRSG
jgi:hypothetical protein